MRADERSDGVILPPGRLGDLGHGRPVFPAQKFQNGLCLAAVAGPGFLPGFRRCGCYLFRGRLDSALPPFSRARPFRGSGCFLAAVFFRGRVWSGAASSSVEVSTVVVSSVLFIVSYPFSRLIGADDSSLRVGVKSEWKQRIQGDRQKVLAEHRFREVVHALAEIKTQKAADERPACERRTV